MFDYFKPAVVTPYSRESLSLLRQCHDSCRLQTAPCTHFLVSDGFPIEEIDNWDVEHVKLPRSHDDCGNTPRAIGALSAINQGFNPILFLDVDNSYSICHVENALALKKSSREVDIVASFRCLILPDGTSLGPDYEDLSKKHIDTSCLAIFESAFFLIPLWATMTKPLAIVGDRVFYRAALQAGLKIKWTGLPTVNYATNYAHHWKRAGLEVPSDAKYLDGNDLPNFSRERFYAWSRLNWTILLA